MARKWGMIIGLGILVILVIAWGVTLYLQSNPAVLFKTIELMAGKSELGAPVELTTEFDPRENAPRFVIESDSLETKTLNLRIVYPQGRAGERVESRINCSAGDIKINGRVATEDGLFDKIEATPKDAMIFGGLCSDRGCSEINKGCELYVNGGNSDEI